MDISVSYTIRNIETAHLVAISSFLHPGTEQHKLQPVGVDRAARYIISNGLQTTNAQITEYRRSLGESELPPIKIG